jgi:ribonuclease HII
MVIIGVDEAGRGAWAGPLVVCALRLDSEVDGITDSKILSKRKRELLREQIITCSTYSFGIIDNHDIDQYGLTRSTKAAIEVALKVFDGGYDQIIIDGNYNYLSTNKKASAVIKADFNVPVVSAASILAKTKRDEIMQRMHKKYPGYGFDLNVGYGTKKHIEALNKLGLTEIHRKSYKPIKKYK